MVCSLSSCHHVFVAAMVPRIGGAALHVIWAKED